MKIKQHKMTNFCSFNRLVLLLFFITKTCRSDDVILYDSKSSASDDVSGSDDDSSESGLDFDQDVCELPIDAGDCGDESLATHGNSLSDNAIKELYEINELYEVKELYEINERFRLKQLNGLKELKDRSERHIRYFGYNRNTEKCEEFNFDGCGGNDNRFASLRKCKKTCYTPLKYFLSEVTDLLLLKFTNSKTTSKVPAM